MFLFPLPVLRGRVRVGVFADRGQGPHPATQPIHFFAAFEDFLAGVSPAQEREEATAKTRRHTARESPATQKKRPRRREGREGRREEKKIHHSFSSRHFNGPSGRFVPKKLLKKTRNQMISTKKDAKKTKSRWSTNSFASAFAPSRLRGRFFPVLRKRRPGVPSHETAHALKVIDAPVLCGRQPYG